VIMSAVDPVTGTRRVRLAFGTGSGSKTWV
jgi:hypothetical protein